MSTVTKSEQQQSVFSADEAASYLRISRATLNRLVKSGAIKAGKLERRILFHRDALDRVAKGEANQSAG